LKKGERSQKGFREEDDLDFLRLQEVLKIAKPPVTRRGLSGGEAHMDRQGDAGRERWTGGGKPAKVEDEASDGKRMNLEARKNEGDRRTRGGIERWDQEQQRE